MNDEALDDFLAHYGVKGMKWGKHQSKEDFKADVKTQRKELYKGVGEVYKSRTQTGIAAASILLASPAVGSAVIGTQMMRGAGFSKGKSMAVGLLAGPTGAVVAIEMKARRLAREED